MRNYLGETVVDVTDTPFKDYTPGDWALYFIDQYGGIDGEHHKLWVMDQAARVLNGAQPIIKLARWDDGHEEYRITLGEPTDQYHAWVADLKDGEDGPDTYEYDTGIAP